MSLQTGPVARRRWRTVTLSKEEHEKLVDLYMRARASPVIAMSVADGMAGRDFATRAWDSVREFMDELGRKYGYDPKTAKMSVDSPTFEVEA